MTDQGPGITEDEQSRIFEKFYRGSRGQHLKGTGMGLAIAREIVRAHGEDIWVRSSPGQGSEFCFSLPIAPVGSSNERRSHPRRGRRPSDSPRDEGNSDRS